MDSKNGTLKALVCGYERGGTSLIAELLRQHPALDGGFEGGFLLGKGPRDFLSISPYRSNVKPGWGITEEELRYICDTDSWEDLYSRLRARAREVQDKRAGLFDKTPKYMEVLPKALKRVPHVPCIVVVRDPRAVLWSWAKRSGAGVDNWLGEHLKPSCERYVQYGKGWRAAIKGGLAPRIFLVRYEALCMDPRAWAMEIFRFLEMEFSDSFLHFSPKFANVYGSTPSPLYIEEYKRVLPDRVCKEILSRTRSFRDWHW